MIRQVSSSFSIAVLSSVIQTGQDLHYARIAEGVTVDSPAAAAFLNRLAAHFQGQGLAGQDAQTLAIAFLHSQAGLQAAVQAFHDAFGVATLFGILGLIPALAFFAVRAPKVEESKDSKGFQLH